MNLSQIKAELIREAVTQIFLTEGTFDDLVKDNDSVTKWEPFENESSEDIVSWIDDATENIVRIVTGTPHINRCWLIGVDYKGKGHAMGFPFEKQALAAMDAYSYFHGVVHNYYLVVDFCNEHGINPNTIQISIA